MIVITHLGDCHMAVVKHTAAAGESLPPGLERVTFLAGGGGSEDNHPAEHDITLGDRNLTSPFVVVPCGRNSLARASYSSVERPPCIRYAGAKAGTPSAEAFGAAVVV